MSDREAVDTKSPPEAPAVKLRASPLPVAVIDMGTSSIRMVVAQVLRGRYTVLDSLQMAVALGKDTFTRGRIEKDTTEECVRVLRSFKRLLGEYNVIDDQRITAIATSAVREAANCEAFLDRLYIATGINVKVIDQAEVNRFTYLAVRPVLETESFWKRSDSLVIEAGGGSTEVLMFRRGRIGTAHLYRLGSLRLRKLVEEFHAPNVRGPEILQGHVDQTVAQIAGSIAPVRSPAVVALGAEARFACARLVPDWDRKTLGRFSVSALARLTSDVLRQSTDELVRRYRITYPEAETLGPALLLYARLARALKIKTVHVSDVSLRNGVLAEIASGGAWAEEFKRQILNSALALGKRYAVDPRHAQYVAALARRLFRLLRREHSLDTRYELVLSVAALLHESGQYISRSSHHKHSLYIILNSDLFGLGSEDRQLTALVARYHRRAMPQPTHEYYLNLDREGRIRVSKLAAILRVADALDAGHIQRIKDVEFELDAGRLLITAAQAGSLALEQQRLTEKGGMFEQVYGMKIVLQGT